MDLTARNPISITVSCIVLLFVSTTVQIFAATGISDTPRSSPTVVPSTTQTEITTDRANQSTNSTILSTPPSTRTVTTVKDSSYLQRCPYDAICSDLGADCISCKLNHYCVYGAEPLTECTVKPNITCVGEKTFTRQYHCRYGYQLEKSLYYCDTVGETCTMKKAPPETYFADCHVRDHILCLGSRTFYKKFTCNWTMGYKWSTALVLSITLGGFGVDRFYLGLWREGIGKLFSFGGLGVWTLVDVILIAVGYVGPHDGSLYIYPWS